MSLILNIDTALDEAWVSLATEGNIIDKAGNKEKNDHAAWLNPAIQRLFERNARNLGQLQAVAVSIGPGSYTGLRIGLASAKGFCYALKIPLIAVPTLEIIALSVIDEVGDLVCPLVDARRMEVFTAVYDKNLVEKMKPLAMILHINSFETLLATHKILFCGNGANKLKAILSHRNAGFSGKGQPAEAMAILSFRRFQEKKVSDLAYTEPLYMKEFQSSASKE